VGFSKIKNRKEDKNLLSGEVDLTGKLANEIIEDFLRFCELPDYYSGSLRENEIRK